MHGEQLVVDVTARVGRRNRSRVNVRVVGDSSFTWIDLVFQWGANLEAVVADNAQLSQLLKSTYQFATTSPSDAVKLPPHGPWHGLMFSTLRTTQDKHLIQSLFHAWLPGDLIIALHSKHSRKELMEMIPEHSHHYHLKISKARHSDFGGASRSVWSIVHLSRLIPPITVKSLMTEEHYPQTLQASLDDTQGAAMRGALFEPRFGENYCGMVKLKDHPDTELRVYDADGLAPDLAAIQSSRFWFFWVQAASVWSGDSKILRPVKLYELFSIWDFEGKLECQSKSRSQSMTLLQHRLWSPPGKISRLITHHLLESRVAFFDTTCPPPTVVPIKARKAEDIPFAPLEELADVRAEAACPDDAEIDLSIWAPPDEEPKQAAARMVLRRFAVKWWADYHTRKAHEWLARERRSKFDVREVNERLKRVQACRYFKWVRGSSILYWRLPEEWHADFRDGVKCWELPDAVLPQGRMHNIPTESREQELLTREKIFRLRFNWYLEKGPVKLVIPRFAVPKATDVRVVWDSKANGHNKCLWAPSFILGDFGDLEEIVVKWLSVPVDIYLQMGSPDQDYSQEAHTFIKSWQADIDVGQQFNNYAAHHQDRPYLGVRMIDTNNDGSMEKHWFARFSVLHFGGRASPYIAGMGQQRILEWAKGPPSSPKSPFQFDKVVLNLPTAEGWDPSLPRVMRIRKDGELASAEVNYVDDIHPTSRGISDTEAVITAKYLKSRMNSVGNQADDKKYRRPTCRPGAWKGEIMHTDQPFPRKSTTVKKWNRFKDGVSWILEQARVGETAPTSELRRIAGLGINVTDVYKDARCYLKGIFNAVESFRANRDVNGWRIKIGAELEDEGSSELAREDSGLTPLQLEASMESAERLELEDASTAVAANGYPLLTNITPEMLMHCEALLELFEADTPVAVYIRPASASSYRYYVGDASREGLGGATQFPDGTIKGRRGVWLSQFAKGGSNVRESQNQVNHLLKEVRAGVHDGCEVWGFTDNSVWALVWLKGLSTAKHLFDLVLELKIECRKHEVYLHVCHISGNRMIETGIDGWSRGDFEAGISLGYDLRNYLPLELSCFNVASATLIPWLRSWLKDDYKGPLGPEGWFWDGHMPGIHVWIPPPAAALIALKQLSRSKHKRPYDLTHIVLIPRILYWEEWQSRFEKEMDIWFVMHSGSVWPHYAHEPLVVGPIHGFSDWSLKRWWKLVARCLRCQKRVTFESGIICANFGATRGRFPKCAGAWCAECFSSHDLDFFEIKLPRDFNGASLAEVEDEKRFKCARPGDHICTSFQCPNCQSQNIRGRSLDPSLARDQAFEALAIRATLDAFWASSSATVKSHVTNVRFMRRYGAALDFLPMPALGPFPLYKHGGMLEAIILLLRSTEKGRKNATVQYSTARKVRSTLTKIWEASPESGADIVLSSASRKGRYVATHCPSESRWYEHFALGVCARMGDVVSQDRAYTIEVLHKLLEAYELEWQQLAYEIPLKTMCAVMFLLVSSLGGMRGFEVMWTDLAALRYDLNYCEEIEDYSAISWPIVGRFKAHDGRLGCYMIPIAGVTRSGIQFFTWTQRFVGRLAMEGHCDGWAFKRADGSRAKASDYMEDIYQRLEIIQATTSLIDSECDVRSEYGAQRSGRRFLTTNATIQGVLPHIIELQCRWQTDRANGERSVVRSMIHLYSEVRNMKKTLIQPSLVC